MSNRRRTSSDLSLEIIDILKNIQYNSKPVEIKIKLKRRQRDQYWTQCISKSPNPNDYIQKESGFTQIFKNK